MGSAQAITFGQLLKRYRLAARLSQEALAERSGLAVRSISDLERDVRRLPHPDTIQRVAAALRLSAQDQTALAATARRRGAPASAPSIEDSLAHALTPLVGRAEEMDRVARFLASQEPPVLLFGGEPGIGKSRLLHEAAERAHATGWRVLTGGCTRRGGQASYAPLTNALEQAIARTAPEQQRLDLQGCAWLSRLLPELDQRMLTPAPSWTLPPEQERRLLFAAVSRYLTNVAGPSGTLLVLDDLQWASDDALDLLECLARDSAAAAAVTLRMVGAYRDTEAPPEGALGVLMADLGRDGLATQHPVRALDHHESLLFADLLLITLRDTTDTQGHAPTELTMHSTPAQSAAARQLVQRAGGVPFFLESCAIGWRLGGGTDGTDGVRATSQVAPDTAPDQPQTPWRVTASIRQRVAALPLDSQQVVSALAVVGRSAPFALLAATLGQPEWPLVRAVEAACQARVLEEAQSETLHLTTYQFPHDLIRDTVAHDLSAARRVILHRAVGDALESFDVALRRPAELAYHFAQAGEHARALLYALLAGDQAEAVYAHAEAAGHYRVGEEAARALGDKAREADALEKEGKAVLVLGHADDAFALLDSALCGYQAVNDQQGELRALSALLEAYIGRDMVDEAVARAHAVLARVEPQEEPDTSTLTPALASGLAAVYNSLARLYFTSGRYHEQLRVARQAGELARAAEDETQLVRASHRLIVAEAALGHEPDRAALEDLLARADRIGEILIASSAHNMIAEGYQFAGEFAQMMAAQEQAVAVAERGQDAKRVAWNLGGLAERAYYLGDWRRAREANARAEAILRELDRYGPSFESVSLSYWRSILALAEGRENEGRRLLEHLIASAEKLVDPLTLVHATGLLAEADLLARHAEQARLRLASVLQHAAIDESNVHGVMPLLAWAEGALGQEAHAEARLATLLASAEPLYRVDGLRVRGLLAIAQRRWAVADEALDEALRMCRAMPYPYAEAKTLWVHGQLEVARGDSAGACERFEQALAICSRLGEGLYRPHIADALARVSSRADTN